MEGAGLEKGQKSSREDSDVHVACCVFTMEIT